MGWSDDENEDIDLAELDATLAERARRQQQPNGAEPLIDDEAAHDTDEADGDEDEPEVEVEEEDEDGEEKKSALTAAEKEETGNKAQTALLYMVHQMAEEVGPETGMTFSKQTASLDKYQQRKHIGAAKRNKRRKKADDEEDDGGKADTIERDDSKASKRTDNTKRATKKKRGAK